MIYEWKCKVCTAQGDVVRSIDDSAVPPTDEEAAPWGSLLMGHDHEWVKVYSSTTDWEHLRDKGVFERTGDPR